MSAPPKAVFLSYASQDAEAAKRIADALRAAGVEVWFDAEGGLEHGDEWDAKIRRQIKECVLFLPIISANTQAREEGYFRIEWDLAAERVRGIASGVAFVLPVVVDGTRESDALVPDRFRTVQWTKLPGGNVPPDVLQRFLKLWSHRTGALKHEARESDNVGGTLRPDGSGESGYKTPPTNSASPGWKVYAGLALAVFALAAGAAWWMGRKDTGVKPVETPMAASVVAPVTGFPRDSELKRAWNMVLGAINATAEDFALAEDMVKAVVTRRPTDPEAAIVYAWLHNAYLNRGFDISEERHVLARRYAERAVQLAPDDAEALGALGQFLSFRRADLARAEQLLRRAIELNPREPRFYRALSYNVLRFQQREEAMRVAERAAELFPGDPLVFYELALHYRDAGRIEEMDRTFDRALALAPIGAGMIWKSWIAGWVRGDLAAMKSWLDKVPANLRLSDRALIVRTQYALLTQQPADLADVTRALQAFPGAGLKDFYYTGPKALLVGDLYAAQGKAELARSQYELTLASLAPEKALNPTDFNVLTTELWALIGLDQRNEALASARLLAGTRPQDFRPRFLSWWFSLPRARLLLGDRAGAVQIMEQMAGHEAVRQQLRVALRIDPRVASFRDDAGIKALLAEPAKAAAIRDWPKDPELKKAIGLIEGLEAIPDDFSLAEEIAKRVLDRSPTDIEAVTVMARLQAQYMRRGFDRSDERAALAKRYAERALQLAPDEPEAMYALATYHFSRATGETARTEQLLRRAMELDPTNPRPGRLLADLFNATNRLAEAITQGQDNIRRFPNDVLSHYDLARIYKDQGRYDEFDRALDATLAIAPLPNAIVWKARLQFGLRNDFAGMKAWLDRVPARVRGTERAVFGYFIYAAFGGDPEAGLGALRDFPQKWFTDFEYAGPTALLNASLLELQGKKELARRQYEVAQGEILRMRQTDPGRIGLSQVEFWTLLGLGRNEEAKISYRRVVEGTRRPYAQDMVNGWWFTTIPAALLIGDRTTALTFLRESIATRPESRAAFRLRFQIDPRMAPFRDDAEIKALLAGPEGKK